LPNETLTQRKMYHCCGFSFRQPWCHEWKKNS